MGEDIIYQLHCVIFYTDLHFSFHLVKVSFRSFWNSHTLCWVLPVSTSSSPTRLAVWVSTFWPCLDVKNLCKIISSEIIWGTCWSDCERQNLPWARWWAEHPIHKPEGSCSVKNYENQWMNGPFHRCFPSLTIKVCLQQLLLFLDT